MALSREEIISQVMELAQSLVTSVGMELVDIEYVRRGRDAILRLFIDKEGGVTLDDCADISREFSVLLDVEDIIPVRYTLEVSSPGLDRPLRRLEDFQRFIGRLAKIKTHDMMPDDAGNMRKTFLGNLVDATQAGVSLKLVEGQGAIIPLESVEKANLEYEF